MATYIQWDLYAKYDNGKLLPEEVTDGIIEVLDDHITEWHSCVPDGDSMSAPSAKARTFIRRTDAVSVVNGSHRTTSACPPVNVSVRSATATAALMKTDPPLKYVECAVTLAEVPVEISLTISISNCLYHCHGCHSQYLQQDIGKPL